jgi:hypothetical protein
MVFQRNWNVFIIYTLVFMLLMSLVIFKMGLNKVSIAIVFFTTAYYVGGIVGRKGISRIEIRDTNLKIKVTRFLLSKESFYSFDEISYSFKKEHIARGTKGKRFRLFYNNEQIALSSHGVGGWTLEKLEEIVSEFKKLSIKEKL